MKNAINQKLKNKTSAVSRFCLVSGALQPCSAEAIIAAEAGQGNPTRPATIPVGASASDTAKDLRQARASPRPSDCQFRENRQAVHQNAATVTVHPSKNKTGLMV